MQPDQQLIKQIMMFVFLLFISENVFRNHLVIFNLLKIRISHFLFKEKVQTGKIFRIDKF
jgi:hypothetical protein